MLKLPEEEKERIAKELDLGLTYKEIVDMSAAQLLVRIGNKKGKRICVGNTANGKINGLKLVKSL